MQKTDPFYRKRFETSEAFYFARSYDGWKRSESLFTRLTLARDEEYHSFVRKTIVSEQNP